MNIITITGAENSTKIKLNIEVITFIDLWKLNLQCLQN